MKLTDLTQEFEAWMKEKGCWDEYLDNFSPDWDTDTPKEENFIMDAFEWSASSQGGDFWDDFDDEWKDYLNGKETDKLEEEKASALSTQQGGTHYTDMKLQPVELAYSIGGTPCFTKLAKYLTRDKGDRKLNLEKAIHVIDLEVDLFSGTMYSNYYDNFSNSRKGCDILFVVSQIIEFTDNELYKLALTDMYYYNYEDAKKYVQQVLEEL